MTEEIKRIIEELKENIPTEEYRSEGTSDGLTHYEEDKDSWQYKLLDYITNLQQDLDKANDIIEKDRQFYKCRMDEYTELKKENEKLKYWLNDVIFDEKNIDVELPARYLKKLGYIDFDDENKVYINKHNNSPFMQEDNKEKAFYLKDEELSEYTKQLESENKDYKLKCNKAIEYINFVINHYKEQLKTPIEDTYFDSNVNRKGYILSIIAYLQTTLDTLIGSDEK